MGQKVNPKSYRLILDKDWNSRWITKSLYAYTILADSIIRDAINGKLGKVGIDKIVIERNAQETKVIIHTSKPGIIIGRSGKGIQELKKCIERNLMSSTNYSLINSQVPISKINEIKKKLSSNIKLNISEIRNHERSASLVAQDIASQLERRMPYRKVVKRILSKIESNRTILGAKIAVAGRLGGVDIARREKFTYGSIPLATLKSNVDYAYIPAQTTHGVIGVKVWIYSEDLQDKK